jgi:hypothetical protein
VSEVAAAQLEGPGNTVSELARQGDELGTGIGSGGCDVDPDPVDVDVDVDAEVEVVGRGDVVERLGCCEPVGARVGDGLRVGLGATEVGDGSGT